MPGFLGEIGSVKTGSPFSENKNNMLINRKKIINDLYIEQRTVNKFQNDKVFKENDDYFILTEGVILNSFNLIKKYNGKTLFETVINMYNQNGYDFFKEFRGSFSGVFYDKKNNIKIIYTDHIGDKQVFYSQLGNNLIFGSEINYIVDYYKKNNIKYNLNREAAYYLLTYGFMLEDNTLFSQIKKLIAGHYILVKNSKLDIIQYYKLNNTPNYEQSEEEIIENIDKLFRQAIKRAFDKDNEYGYKHLVALSGGLDSRMTTWVAHDMGYGNNIVNFTFSQSNYLDETIPKKIASDLKHEWIFKSLDNGIFLKNIEDVVKICSGGAFYLGLSHGKSCLDLVDKNKFGIVHSGQIGDAVLGGTYNSLNRHRKYLLSDGANSKLLISKLNRNKIKYEYENEEVFKFCERGFNGINQGLLLSQEFTETYSPFYDIDFLNYCLSIPVELRYKHNIYIMWILKKYPQAANYTWETLKGKVTDKKINIFGRQILLKQLPKKTITYILRKLKINKSELNSKSHMNPFDYWYNTNDDLRNFLDSYFEKNINRLNFDEELKNDCEYLYRNGRSIEKGEALTLLAFLKLYF